MALKVMFDHQIAIAQRHGGISRYIAELVTALPSQGIDPLVFAPLHVNEPLGQIDGSLIRGRRIGMPAIARKLVGALSTIAAPVAARIERAAVVHETYYSPVRTAPRRLPKVLTVHDMIHEIFPDQVPRAGMARYKSAAIARADHIICVSENTRRDLLRFHPDVADRASVIPLGLSPWPRQPAPISAGRPYLLHVGHRGGYKNFAAILQAFAQSETLRQDFDLISAGAPFSAEEKRMIAALGLGERVRAEQVDDDGLHQLYRGAAMLVYPSLYEGFGIPPLEAMAAGCPVVTLHVSSIPEVCGDAVEYAEDGSPEALLAAIDRVLGSPERADALREAGYARIARFSWPRCAAETANVYRSLA